MVDEFKDSKKAEDFLVKQDKKEQEIKKGKVVSEKKLNQKIKEEKKEVELIEKEKKNLDIVENKIKSEIKKDEDLALYLSKVTGFFKSKKNKQSKEGVSDKDLSLNFKSIMNFFNKYGVVFLILIAIFFAVFIRMQSANLGFTDGWASSTVDNYYLNQVRAQVDQQYPNLPQANKDAIANQQFADFKSSNKQLFEQQVTELSKQFKGFYKFDIDDKNYMPDIDPYVFLRQAENYLDHGYIGDEKRIIDGKEVQWDTHQRAPLGVLLPPKTIHPYVLAYLHKIIKIFDPKTTPMNSAAFFPVLFALLSVIPAFFIGRRVAGNVGGFFSALIIAIHPAFMGRSLWGHADTDAYNIFFPLFAAWTFIIALDQKDRKKQAIYAIISAFIIGVYALAWDGWWYVFDFIIGAVVLYGLFTLVKEKAFTDKTKNVIITAVIFIVASGIFVSLFSPSGVQSFINAPLAPISFSKLKIAAHETLWPNVYTTVAELNPANFSQILGSLGGGLLFFISLVGIALMFIKRKGKLHIETAILIILWYIGIFYASTKGVRFTMMLVPPFALAFGAALGRIYNGITVYAKKDMHISEKITGVVLIIIFLLLLIKPYNQSMGAANSDVPIVNDAWFNSLNKIKLESAPNAIINSWWDFGHHFKYYADRAVTFDGGSQNTPMAHWIGKVLLTDDEDLAVGILRMLDCGSNTAFEKLNGVINDTSLSVKMLYDIVTLSREDAKNYISGFGVSDSDAEEILKYTHCNPPEDYFITSEDMIGKSGVWAHFGSWDFDRADIWVFAKNMPQNQAVDFIMKNSNVSRDEAEKLYFEVQGIVDEGEANSWIAPWPSYAGTQNCVNVENKTINCGNGITINLTSKEVKVPTQQGIMPPNSFVYKTAQGVTEKESDSSLGLSVALLNAQNPVIVIMQPQLAKSMFTRLYYYEGYGLEHFDLFTHQTGITGTNVYVWKIDWDGKQ